MNSIIWRKQNCFQKEIKESEIFDSKTKIFHIVVEAVIGFHPKTKLL